MVRWFLPLVAAFLLLAGCGGKSASVSPPEDPAAFTARQLTLLDELKRPSQVDDATWSQLKAGLRKMLEAGLSGDGSYKAVLAAPSGGGSAANLQLDAGSATLSWYLALQGDYDQNGEVNIADITPIAQNFGNVGPFAEGSAEAVVDGDGNGEINIADLTPIGQNFGRTANSYNVYRSSDPADVGTGNAPNGAGAELLGTLPLSGAVGGPPAGRSFFSFQLPDLNIDYYFWVRPNDAADGAGEDGTPSNVVDGAAANLPPVAQLNADTNPYEVPHAFSYDFIGSSDPDGTITLYEFDPQGDGVFELNFAALPGPQVFNYTEPGIYNATLRVTDDQGAVAVAVLSQSVYVAGNSFPTASFTVTPDAGAAPLSVHVDASASTDSDGTIVLYEWDFDEDGEYDDLVGPAATTADIEFVDGGNHQIRLQVTDDGFARGVDGKSVNLTDAGNLPPVAVLAPPAAGPAPLHVTLDGSGSSDPDGSIVEYSWDIDQDGSPDYKTETPFLEHDFSVEGDNEVTLYVRDNDGENSEIVAANVVVTSGWNLTVLSDEFYAPTGLVTVVNDDLTEVPLLAYVDQSGPVFNVVTRLGSSDASTFAPPVVAAADAFEFDVELVSGLPAIAFVRIGGDGVGGLYFTQADDKTAMAWGAPVAADSSGQNIAGHGVSLAINNGVPAIAYAHVSNTQVRYVRAADLDGNAWGLPVVAIDLVEDLDLRNPELLMTPGFLPAIGVADRSVGGGFFARANDPTGLAWGAAVQNGNPNVYSEPSTVVLPSGIPAIAWGDGNKLQFSRATDSTGQTWEAPITAFTVNEPTSFYEVVMIVTDQGPAIGCKYGGTDGVLFIQAGDADGNTWGAPELLDSHNGAGAFLSMAVLNGRPILAYSGNGSPGTLRVLYKD
jgi:PKD repeat protein